MSLRLLLGLDLRRAADAVRRPRVGFWAGTALPILLLGAGAWLAGDGLRPDLRSGDGRFLLGVLTSAPIAFQSYPILFRPADDALLRRLGVPAQALYAQRALRLLLLALGVVLLLTLPFARGGTELGVAASVAGTAAAAGWAAALLFTSRGAELTVRAGRRRGVSAGFIGWDRELADNAPLVYAPLLPVVLASFSARLLPGAGAVWIVAWLGAGAVLVALGRRRFAAALPRFAPHAAEIAWAPDADTTGDLVTGRGPPGLLPRGAQLTLARDALVASRRFRWAARLVPIVGGVAALALLRGGEDPATRRWIVLACAGALATLAGVVLALGRGERGRTRWLDRAHGLSARDRLIGRASFAAGRALVLAVPVGLAWASVAPSPAWPWWAAAAAGSLLVAGMSLLAAGR